MAAAVPRHLEEELKQGQTQQSRVQGPLLQQRKEATGSGMSGMKQSSCSFQRHIRRELELMPFGPRAGMLEPSHDWLKDTCLYMQESIL